MMIDLGWKAWAVIAAVITAIAGTLCGFGIIPWWGVVIAVPVVTITVVGGLALLAIFAWMARGSH